MQASIDHDLKRPIVSGVVTSVNSIQYSHYGGVDLRLTAQVKVELRNFSIGIKGKVSAVFIISQIETIFLAQISLIMKPSSHLPKRAFPRACFALGRTHPPPSSFFTSAPALPKSICPAKRCLSAAMVRPMSLSVAASSSLISAEIASPASTSDICFGR
jgi:hypothetical protein